MSATYKTRIILPYLPLKICRPHIKFRKLFSSHSVSCKCMFLNILAKSKITLIIHQIENSGYETLVSICFPKPSCCTNYNTSSNAGFEEVTVLKTIWINHSDNPVDSSFATYCSQPFEFVRNILHDKSILIYFFMFTFIPYNLEVIKNIK